VENILSNETPVPHQRRIFLFLHDNGHPLASISPLIALIPLLLPLRPQPSPQGLNICSLNACTENI
jgi:hypothetical protein